MAPSLSVYDSELGSPLSLVSDAVAVQGSDSVRMEVPKHPRMTSYPDACRSPDNCTSVGKDVSAFEDSLY